MINKKMWLIVISVVAISASVNAFAMMNGNNDYHNNTQNYGYGDSHMSDYDRGFHNRNTYGVPRSDYDNLNGNNYNSRMHDYNRDYRGYQRNYQGPYKDNNYRRNYDRNMNPYEDRFREDHRYQRD